MAHVLPWCEVSELPNTISDPSKSTLMLWVGKGIVSIVIQSLMYTHQTGNDGKETRMCMNTGSLPYGSRLGLGLHSYLTESSGTESLFRKRIATLQEEKSLPSI